MRSSARIGAFACLGVALAMAALSLRGTGQPDQAVHAPAVAAPPADPLQARLRQCQQAGEAAASDADCLTAWAENRRRFLGLGRAQAAGPTPSPWIDDGNSAAALADPAPAAAQPQEH